MYVILTYYNLYDFTSVLGYRTVKDNTHTAHTHHATSRSHTLVHVKARLAKGHKHAHPMRLRASHSIGAPVSAVARQRVTHRNAPEGGRKLGLRARRRFLRRCGCSNTNFRLSLCQLHWPLRLLYRMYRLCPHPVRFVVVIVVVVIKPTLRMARIRNRIKRGQGPRRVEEGRGGQSRGAPACTRAWHPARALPSPAAASGR